MNTLLRLHAAAIGAALTTVVSAAPGLTPGNDVDAGDTIVEMLDTSALAFSTMLGPERHAAPSPHVVGVRPSDPFVIGPGGKPRSSATQG